MGLIPSLTTISGTISAAPHNNNYTAIRTAVNTYCAFVDQAATITGAWTFSTAPTFSNAQTFAAGVTVTTGGVTITAGGLTVTAGASTFGAAVTITGTCTATTFSGSGASLTSLPAANLTGTLPAISGANLTNLNGSNIASGTVSASRLPTSYTALTITTATVTSITGNAGNVANTQNFATLGAAYTNTAAATPIALASAPYVGTSWTWIKFNVGGVDCVVPGLIA